MPSKMRAAFRKILMRGVIGIDAMDFRRVEQSSELKIAAWRGLRIQSGRFDGIANEVQIEIDAALEIHVAGGE